MHCAALISLMRSRRPELTTAPPPPAPPPPQVRMRVHQQGPKAGQRLRAVLQLYRALFGLCCIFAVCFAGPWCVQLRRCG